MNKERIKKAVLRDVSKNSDTVTVRVGQRGRSNDLYKPMYDPQLFDEIVEEFYQSSRYGNYVRDAIERGFVGVPPDIPEAIGEEMKQFMRARKQLFAQEGRTFRHPDTRDTWVNIADRFIQSDPDYERTGWEDYSSEGGYHIM